MPADIMSGSALAVILFDVGEEVQMDRLRRKSGARAIEGALSTPRLSTSVSSVRPSFTVPENTISPPASSFGHASSSTITA
jgi:hypothetical protein